MRYFCEVEILDFKRLFIGQKELGIKEYDIIVIGKLLHGAVCSYRKNFFVGIKEHLVLVRNEL